MKLSKSSKKVSWAPDANLCQAKLFLSKDCPSQICLKAHDGLLANKSWILHCDGLDTNGLPHGFKDRTGVNQLKKKVSHIPKIKWKLPPKFVLSSNWLVASGEESQEAEAQKLREKQVVEAVYPLISAIPPSPSISLDIEECHQDDCDIPLVPTTPMEDEGTVDRLFDLAAPINTSIISKPPALSQDLLESGTPHTPQCNRPVLEPPAIEKPALGMSPGVEADMIAAAAAAISMVMKCKEQGSLIDTDLLIKILTNPKMTEKLINDCRAPGGTVTIPLSESKPVTQLVPISCSEPAIELEPRPANENMRYQPKRVQPALDSRSPQDAFPVSRSKQVAHRVPLPHTNGNMCSVPSDKRPALNSSPLQPDIFPISCSKPVTLLKPESGNMYPLPNAMLPDSNSRPFIPDTVTVSSSPVPLPSKGPDMVLLSQPAKVNLCSLPNDVQPAINSRSPQPDTVQFSRSKPANGNMYSLVDEVRAALNSRPPRPDTVPVSSSQPVSLPVPVLPSIKVDMVASQKVANENFCSLWSGSRSTKSTMHSREPMVPFSGFNPAPLLVCPSVLEPRVLSPRPTNGNLHNILKGVQPTLNTTPTLPGIFPTSSFTAIKSIVKDVNYYKNLVKQHGGEKQGTLDQIIPQYGNDDNYLQGMELKQSFKPTELKPKPQKSCIFYNSPTGCRNGTNCPYQHDMSSQLRGGSMLEDKRAKRMKLDGKITGRK